MKKIPAANDANSELPLPQKVFKALMADRARESIAKKGLHPYLRARLYSEMCYVAEILNWQNDPDIPWEVPREVFDEIAGHVVSIFEVFDACTPRLRPNVSAQIDPAFHRFIQRAVGSAASPGA